MSDIYFVFAILHWHEDYSGLRWCVLVTNVSLSFYLTLVPFNILSLFLSSSRALLLALLLIQSPIMSDGAYVCLLRILSFRWKDLSEYVNSVWKCKAKSMANECVCALTAHLQWFVNNENIKSKHLNYNNINTDIHYILHAKHCTKHTRYGPLLLALSVCADCAVCTLWLSICIFFR